MFKNIYPQPCEISALFIDKGQLSQKIKENSLSKYVRIYGDNESDFILTYDITAFDKVHFDRIKINYKNLSIYDLILYCKCDNAEFELYIECACYKPFPDCNKCITYLEKYRKTGKNFSRIRYRENIYG